MKKAEYIAELKRRLANFSPSEVEDTNYHTPSNAWIAAGGGFLCIGLGLLLSILFFSLIRTVLPAFTNALTRLYHKAQGGKRHENA